MGGAGPYGSFEHASKTRPARGGNGPERVHWEEAGVLCDLSRIFSIPALMKLT